MYKLTITHLDPQKKAHRYAKNHETLSDAIHAIEKTLPEIHKKAGFSEDLAYFHTEETTKYITHKIGSHASTTVQTVDDFAMVRVTKYPHTE